MPTDTLEDFLNGPIAVTHVRATFRRDGRFAFELFCVDKHKYILKAEGVRVKLMRTENGVELAGFDLDAAHIPKKKLPKLVTYKLDDEILTAAKEIILNGAKLESQNQQTEDPS